MVQKLSLAKPDLSLQARDAVTSLVNAAIETSDGTEAMKFTQAAVNAASAFSQLRYLEHMPNPDDLPNDTA